MNVTKKMFALLMAFTIFCSMGAFALTFPDVSSDDANEEAVNVLSSLGIIKGYEDGEFKPDKEVTRAELTSLLMRMLNLSITGVEVTDSGYIDVPNNHWAVYDIRTASSMGIILGFGDGNFGPEQSVTFEQAVKMVVAMLGYEQQAIEYGGWPDGYMRSARDLDILRRGEMVQTNPAPRKIIAQILYNSLEVDLMVRKSTSSGEESYGINRGQNLMTEYMKIDKVTGTLMANSVTRFDGAESTLLEDEVEIAVDNAKKKYKVGVHPSAKDLLGLNIIAYTKYDENRVNEEILHIMTRSKVEEFKVEAKQIVNFTNTRLTYERSGSDRTFDIAIAANPIVIYNGKYIDRDIAFNNGLVQPDIGSVTLVNSGSGYNLIKVESYKNYVVRTVDTTNNEIYYEADIVSGTDTKLRVPLHDIFGFSISIKKGNTDFSFNSLRKGHVISVKENHSSQVGIKTIEILVSDTKKTGKVTGIDDNVVTVGDAQYGISNSLNGTTMKNDIRYNASGTFYLDSFNEIAYVEFNVGDTYKYGYLVRAVVETSGGEGTGAARIYDYSTKTFRTLTFANRVTVNGVSSSDHDAIIDKLEDSAGLMNQLGDENKNTTYTQVIKFLTNNSGQINEIVTIKESSSDDLFRYYSYGDQDFTYNSTNKYFRKPNGTTITVDSKTAIFNIPYNRSDENNYGFLSLDKFTNGYQYAIEVVEQNNSGVVTAMVVYESNVNKNVHYQSPLMVITEISTVKDDGVNKTKLKGIGFADNSNMEYLVDPIVDDGHLKKGDVVRFGLTVNNEANKNLYQYFSPSQILSNTLPNDITASDQATFLETANYPMNRVVMNSSATGNYVSNSDISRLTDLYVFMFGSVVATNFDLNQITFADYVEDGILPEGDPSIILTVDTNVVFHTFENNNHTSKKATQNDIEVLIGQTETAKGVYIHVRNGSLRAVYIVR